MTYAEELYKLRKRMLDAAAAGVVNDQSKDLVETLLIQIMNDGERNRQQCLTQSDNLRKQAATLDGQAAAFASINSIVYNVLNGFIHSAEITKEENKRIEEENQQKTEYIEELDKNKGKKKK